MISDAMRSLVEELVLRPDAPGDIIQFSNEVAQLRMDSGESLWLLHTPHENLYPKLHEFLSSLVKGMTLGRARVVMIGGNDSVHEVLERSRPGRFQRGELRVHHLRENGTWWHGPNSEKPADLLEVLEGALREPRSARFNDANFMFALSQALERGKARQREMSRFRVKYDNKLPWATYTLMALILLSFGAQHLFGGSTFVPTQYRMGANVNSQLGEDFEWWRLLSSVFLHSGMMHFAFNTYVVYALGTFLERIFGASRYMILVVLSGLLGSVASYLFGGGFQSVGASGAFWGFLGASAALGLRPGVLIPVSMVAHLKKVALFNLALNLGVSFLPGIDLLAHLGGGVMGFILVWSGVLQQGLGSIDLSDRESTRSKQLTGAIAGILFLGMMASVATAWTEGKPWELTQEPEFSYRQVPETEFELTVPLGWEEERIDLESLAGIAFGYGHLLRDGAQFIVELRPLGSDEISATNVRMILEASKTRMEEEGPKVEWIEEEQPYLRQTKTWPSGVLTTRLIRVRDGFLQSVYWESIGETQDKALFVEPQIVFESIRSITMR